ncbi:unnamed protein product [Wickerhamomyces anomalus]
MMKGSSKSSTVCSSQRFKTLRWDPLAEAVGDLSTRSDECLNDQVALTQPDVVKEFLCPVPSTLKNSIIQFRESFSNDIHNPIPSSRFIITGPREVNDHHQAIACSYWLLNKSNLSISDSIINAKKSPDKIQKLYSSNNTPLKNLKLAMNLDISGEIKASNSSYMAQTAFPWSVRLSCAFNDTSKSNTHYW